MLLEGYVVLRDVACGTVMTYLRRMKEEESDVQSRCGYKRRWGGGLG